MCLSVFLHKYIPISSSFIKKSTTLMLLLRTTSLLIISISILVMTFSIFFQKETAGSWDKAEEYYLTAQEGYGFDTINNLNVLVHQGQTFSVDEVKELEKTPGVTYIESSPFHD
ncbi:hypothetical protein [Niallia circulans]|jgi:putative ABC transport system permease protein|uniref:hypothetical protein n=1 Tax=Niallia circulans TaxID=1397 RepID=UPI0035232EE4